jgi:hypothetical protein
MDMIELIQRIEQLEMAVAALEAKKKTVKAGADWLAELKANPLFKHVDFAAEERKIAIWKLQPKNVNRQITKRFWLNWLAKVDTAVPVHSHAVGPKAYQPLPRTATARETYIAPPAVVLALLNRIGKGI